MGAGEERRGEREERVGEAAQVNEEEHRPVEQADQAERRPPTTGRVLGAQDQERQRRLDEEHHPAHELQERAGEQLPKPDPDGGHDPLLGEEELKGFTAEPALSALLERVEPIEDRELKADQPRRDPAASAAEAREAEREERAPLERRGAGLTEPAAPVEAKKYEHRDNERGTLGAARYERERCGEAEREEERREPRRRAAEEAQARERPLRAREQLQREDPVGGIEELEERPAVEELEEEEEAKGALKEPERSGVETSPTREG